jgi:hypothetical protein
VMLPTMDSDTFASLGSVNTTDNELHEIHWIWLYPIRPNFGMDPDAVLDCASEGVGLFEMPSSIVLSRRILDYGLLSTALQCNLLRIQIVCSIVGWTVNVRSSIDVR